MDRIKRFFLSLLIAFSVAITVTTIAHAVYGYVSEASAGFTSSGLSAAPCGTCQDGNAKRGGQAPPSRWGQWDTSTDNVHRWWAFVPNITGDFAGVKYNISNSAAEVFFTTVNQNSWKGSYVYLGFLDFNSTWARSFLPNNCVTGYACDGRYIYYDKNRFEY